MPDMSERREIPSSESFPLHTDVAVRFNDVDAMGHVNNAVYLTFFEEARVGLFTQGGMASEDGTPLEARFPFILAEATCRYLSPARVGETLRVYLRLARIGTTSFDLEYLILERNERRPVATGRTVQVAFDYTTRRPIPVPEEVRALLERCRG
jgi:acyl-CoA thioester hydrolase